MPPWSLIVELAPGDEGISDKIVQLLNDRQAMGVEP